MIRSKANKLLLTLCFSGLLILSSFAQTAGDYRTVGAGNWSTIANWQKYSGSSWIAATAYPTSADGAITILTSITLDVSITVDNTTVGSLGSLTISSGITMTIADAVSPGNDLTLNLGRTITNNGTIINTGQIQNNATAAASFNITSTGVLKNLNTTSTTIATITTAGTSLTFQSGAKYQHDYSYSFSPTGTIPTANWITGSTCEIFATGSTGTALGGLGQSFGYFIWNCANQGADINFNGAFLTAKNDFTVKNTNTKNLILKGSTAGSNTTINGNLIVVSTGKLIFTNGDPAFGSSTHAVNVTGYVSILGICTLNASSTVTAASNGANATLTADSLCVGSGGTLNLSAANLTGFGTSGCNGTVTIANNCGISGGTLNLSSSSFSVTSSGGNGTLTVGGRFTISTGTLNFSTSTITGSGGNGTLYANGSNCNISGGTVNLSSSATPGTGCIGTLNVAGNFNHSAGTVSKTSTASGIVNINGTSSQSIASIGFTSGNAITFNISQTGSGTSSITGSFTIQTGTTFNINDNTANDPAADLTISGTCVGNGVINLNNSATLDMGTASISGTGSFTMFSAATLLTKHTQGISSSGATGSIQVAGTRTFPSDGDYTYNGTAAQITGTGLPTALTGVLKINNSLSMTSAGGVTLTQSTSTDTTLLLTAGKLITTTGTLMTLLSTATVVPTGGSALSYVDGPIKKIGYTSGTEFVFPTGHMYGTPNVSKWARAGIINSVTNTTDGFTLEYVRPNDPLPAAEVVGSTHGAGVDHASYKEYWKLTQAVGTSSIPVIKLYWENNSSSLSVSAGSGISSPIAANLHVVEYNGGMWNDRGAGTITVAGITGSIRSGSAIVLTAGTAIPFTFGSPNLFNTLPIELLSFAGYRANDGNQLNWNTATETNNAYFELERSGDATTFSTIATIKGNGTTTTISNYNHLDTDPLPGINYYRLKQVDYNGEYSYSTIIAIDEATMETTNVQVYPNPSTDVVHIITSGSVTAVTIYDMLGNIVYSVSSELNNTALDFKPAANGMYVVKAATADGKIITSRFIKN